MPGCVKYLIVPGLSWVKILAYDNNNTSLVSVVVQTRNNLITSQWYTLPLLWLLIATSSFVFIEPAPYDVLGIFLFVLFFSLGLKVPANIRTGLVLLGIFIFANIIASLTVADPVITLRSLSVRIYMVVSWFLFVCLIYENPEKVLDTIWKGYIFAAVFSVSVGVLGFHELVPYLEQYVDLGRVRAFFKDPNVYGPFLVPVALYAFAKMETASGVRILFYAGLFLFLSYGILIGFSRGSWLNYVVSGFFYTGLRFATSRSSAQINRLLTILALLIFLLVVFAVIAASVDKIRDMLEIRFQVQRYDLVHGGRLDNQKLILQSVLVHPLGIGASLSEYLFYRAPHNIYLHVLIEAGWFGAIAFYAFIVVTLQKAWRFCMQPTRIQRSYTVIFACIIGILVQSLFIDSTHWRHMYLLFAMLWGPALYWQNEARANQWKKQQESLAFEAT